jgi:paraquat-inducible protein A
MIAADAVLEPAEVWRRLDRQTDEDDLRRAGALAKPIACSGCQQVVLTSGSEREALFCPRCGARLRHRKPDSLSRTAALVATAAILYLPANLIPILTVIYFGAGQPSTIIAGIEELVAAGQYPIAALVFFASVLVPVLKLVGLTHLIVSVRRRRLRRARDRGRLYHVIEWIGRWSMVDIFMIGILTAVVDHGNLAMVVPGFGAVAFAAVVVTTMLASMTFDPRLIWDALDGRGADTEHARA